MVIVNHVTGRVVLQRFNLASSGVVPLLCDCTQSLSSAYGPAKCTA
jgi:hypothetical protein